MIIMSDFVRDTREEDKRRVTKPQKEHEGTRSLFFASFVFFVVLCLKLMHMEEYGTPPTYILLFVVIFNFFKLGIDNTVIRRSMML